MIALRGNVADIPQHVFRQLPLNVQRPVLDHSGPSSTAVDKGEMGVAILAGGVIADAQVARKTIVPIEERWGSLTGNAELISSRVAGGFQWSVRDAISTPDHRLWIHLVSEPEPRAERLHVGVLRATPSVPSGAAAEKPAPGLGRLLSNPDNRSLASTTG